MKAMRYIRKGRQNSGAESKGGRRRKRKRRRRRSRR
jgi:hypothetical protein